MQPSATAEPEKARPAKLIRANGGKSPPWSQLSLRSVLLIALQSEVATGNPHPRVERKGFLRKVIPIKIPSHTAATNRLISQGIFCTNTTQYNSQKFCSFSGLQFCLKRFNM